nr:PfaD family polyunsaturated fatty acid/polyketide biosynthesis protein [Thermoactinomyces sp. CICC 10523]
MGAVSAFGMSGTNVHLVLESYPEERSAARHRLPYYLLALSAKTREALEAKISDMIAFLEKESPTNEDMARISFTLQEGRQHFACRCAAVVRDREDALYLLRQFGGEEKLPNLFTGTVPESFVSQKVMEMFAQELMRKSHAVQKEEEYREILQGLADLYCQGYDLPWEQLWREKPDRMHLPTYPFARNTYWVDVPETATTDCVPAVQLSSRQPEPTPEVSSPFTAGEQEEEILPPDSAIGTAPPNPLPGVSHNPLSEQELEQLQEELAASLAEALYVERDLILPDKKFIELGLDSIVGVEWIKTLNKTYGTSIKATRVYDYPTIRDFARFLQRELKKTETHAGKTEQVPQPAKQAEPANSSALPAVTVLKKGPVPPVPADEENSGKKRETGDSVKDGSQTLSPENLGHPLFQTRYGCKWNYVAGSMAQGVASEALVIAMAKARLLSFFGSAGIGAKELESRIRKIQSALNPDEPYGMCLIANFDDPQEEWEHATLFIKYGIPYIEASAYSSITAPLVYCRIKGIYKKGGRIVFPRRIIGKCSRLEIARQFMSPPPKDLVQQLLEAGLITEEEAELSRSVPMGDDIALEADSGGHTDQGVSSALVPSVIALRNKMQQEHAYPEPIMIGCGGGIGTPEAVASAFMLGADFIFTGSINQCTVESGAHEVVKELLGTVTIHDTAVTVAGDMFEIGAKAQVVRKHTQFHNRANRLYQLFMQYNSIDEIPEEIRHEIETQYFKRTFSEVWDLVCEYKKKKNPQHLVEAEENPRFKMALIFKWYFAYCNRATLNGDETERDNFQIFCGPAMGAFNEWVKGTPYEHWKNRRVAEIAALLMNRACEHIQSRFDRPVTAKGNVTALPGPVEKQDAEETAIAIIGMSGQFPKAKNLEQFWDNLVNGRDCISEIPESRWPAARYYDTDPEAPGKSISKWMGVLEDVDKFDPAFFHIPPVEAIAMDPQQRLFLESCWSCIEDAGLRPSDLSGSRCGVFVGCAPSDYGRLFKEEELNARVLMGGTTSILAARISYLLNLRGPSMAIETACSSSLVAVAEACNSLILGNSDLALAGGVCIMAGPSLHIMTSKAGMLSGNGRCSTFDNDADGFVPGEGVGVVLLKRLSDAIRDKDPIYGVIRGWGVNQDGKTNGITAPSLHAQVELEREVYDRFGINPERISLVEAHGTGTKLGDPIEVEALTEAFRSFTGKKHYCALGSVKSNIGHLLTAAGIAGLIKVLLALKHKTLPPTIHYHRLNEHISLDDSPFYINKSKRPWTERDGVPRLAAVSSFGFSGTNAHIVVEEYLPEPETMAPTDPMDGGHPLLFVLSARNEAQLKTYASRMMHFIWKHQNLNLRDLAYTLQVGREPMDCRMAFVAGSRESILQTLKLFTEGNPPPHLFTASLKREKNGSRDLPMGEFRSVSSPDGSWEGNWEEIARLWVNGSPVDWDKLYGGSRPRRIHLPSYPFERKRFWPEERKSKDLISTGAEPADHLPRSSKWSGGEAAASAAKPAGISLKPLVAEIQQFPDKREAKQRAPIRLSLPDPSPREAVPLSFSNPSEEALQEALADSLAEIMYMERGEIDPDRNFHDLGLDSILGVEWIRVINKQHGTSLEATTLYDYPTIRELGKLILAQQSVQGAGPGLLQTENQAAGGTDPGEAGALMDELADSLAEIMYLDRSEIDPDQNFTDLGLDSILGVEWTRALNKRYGTAIEATALYDYPNLREFAAWMLRERTGRDKSGSEPSASVPPLTLEEVLEQVERGTLEVEKANEWLQRHDLI